MRPKVPDTFRLEKCTFCVHEVQKVLGKHRVPESPGSFLQRFSMFFAPRLLSDGPARPARPGSPARPSQLAPGCLQPASRRASGVPQCQYFYRKLYIFSDRDCEMLLIHKENVYFQQFSMSAIQPIYIYCIYIFHIYILHIYIYIAYIDCIYRLHI